MKLKIDFDIPTETLNEEWPSFFTMGSCFADNQAERMTQSGLDVFSNPFGIIYNPLSIEKILEKLALDLPYAKTDFEEFGSMFSWEHHGDFKYETKLNAVSQSNAILQDSRVSLKKSQAIVITLGTSLVYTFQDLVVANCHKIPNSEFEHIQLDFSEVKNSITNIISLIRKVNDNAQIIFTVSPIRHLKSGVVESSRSKAVLISAVQEVIFDLEKTSYFPAYEIFMDELRDYRFAKEDLTHPTTQAEEYIWNRFCETYYSNGTLEILEEVKKYNQFASHRPIHSAELHNEQVTDKKNTLNNKYPFLNLK